MESPAQTVLGDEAWSVVLGSDGRLRNSRRDPTPCSLAEVCGHSFLKYLNGELLFEAALFPGPRSKLERYRGARHRRCSSEHVGEVEVRIDAV